jgi:UDP-N-acetylmuramyl-tripeptide synthetase
MSLRTLLQDPGVPDVMAANLTLDSREVRPGDVFVAVPGSEQDGREFIAPALAQGAVAVLAEPGEQIDSREARIVPIGNLRSQLGRLANRFYSSPSSDLTVIAVTGTNGKTSVVDLAAQMLRLVGKKTGSVGTLGMRLDQRPIETLNTTPDCLGLHRQLHRWREDGVECVTLEASSHALDQGRLDGLEIDAGVFTNLSRDHLDYHSSMAEYCGAKLRLFRDFAPATRIYNADDMAVAEHRDVWRSDSFGVSDQNAAVAVQFEITQTAPLTIRLRTPWGEGSLQTALSGQFNAFNIVAALTAVLSLGVPFSEALGAAEAVRPVVGRLQSIGADADIRVVIDYAHTPDALERAIRALAEVQAGGQLWVLFGCGGDRDRGKRAKMGAVACRFADRVVVTSDNPRSEAPEAIISDILCGCEAGSPMIEADRAAAIAFAVSEANVGDTVLIAGKGHETYQEVDGVRLPFNDVECAAEHLELRRVA